MNRTELDLIKESNWKRFPPRLPSQPIFYPVTNEAYAIEITRDWNLPRFGNGYVVRFKVLNSFLSRYRTEKVGLDHHTEYWIPAEELEELNDNIIGEIKLIKSFQQKIDIKITDEIVQYVMRYFLSHMTSDEKKGSSNFLVDESIRINNFDANRVRLMKRIQKKTPAIVALMSQGLASFRINTTKRILSENDPNEILNLCPQCYKLTRTPKARQCRHCNYDWH